MGKERVLIWGTGTVAQQTFRECKTINQYDIVGFVDNDRSKWGTRLFGVEVNSLEYLVTNANKADKIVVLSDSYEEIRQQIMQSFPDLEECIDNKYYFYKKSIIARYENAKDPEISKIIEYLYSHTLDVFNYEFVDKYIDFNPDIIRDDSNGLLFTMHNGKKMYFSRKYSNVSDAKRYFKSICVEQDIDSPHRYLAKDFSVKQGDVVIDVGVAEGNFSLDIIDDAKKVYLIEADPLWTEALRYTFGPYRDKVEIIEKYASSYNEGDYATIDSMITDKINFIKMDVEGYEWDALNGAIDTIKKSDNIKIAACCYHSDFDQVLIESFFDQNCIRHTTTKGYMWFPLTCRQSTVSTRLTKGIVRGRK